ncbi:hypothetical protein diail_11214 [Diaporthe ilicicola]|nr:hypothetical protein diail_11214 [Diaporthe ilicicola]
MSTDLVGKLLAEMHKTGSKDMLPPKVEPGEAASSGECLPIIALARRSAEGIPDPVDRSPALPTLLHRARTSHHDELTQIPRGEAICRWSHSSPRNPPGPFCCRLGPFSLQFLARPSDRHGHELEPSIPHSLLPTVPSIQHVRACSRRSWSWGPSYGPATLHHRHT